MKDLNNQQCNRSEDLIAFLYNEISESEARSFERHLHECASCKRELASFGNIRESIGSWREASLAAAWSPAAENESRALLPVVQSRHSAWQAIREFFNLSPLWLKGAAAFASLLFCVCAALAIAYLRTPTTNLTGQSDDKRYTQAELNQQIAAAEQKKEKQLRDEFQTKLLPTPGGSEDIKPTPRVVQPHLSGYAVNTQNLRKPLTRQERNEIAADLGLLTSRDDDDIDLITDRITQTP
jgi:Putative zinc-finger